MSMPSAAAVRHRRPLTGFEVMRVEPTRRVGDAVHVEADHPDERLARAGEALKPTSMRVRASCVVLLDEIGQDTEASRQVQALDDALEQLLQPHDGVDLVGGGIEADDDVAAAVAQTVENGEQDLFLVVARAVWLDPRTEVTGGLPIPSGSGLNSRRDTSASSSSVITLPPPR